MDRLFLDANVLFSAAYREGAGVARLWEKEGCRLITSEYAVDEARRNLPEARQQARLGELLKAVETVPTTLLDPSTRDQVDLSEKDWPILSGAVAAGATHLITGDFRHFGPCFGQTVLGVLVLPPADYLSSSS